MPNNPLEIIAHCPFCGVQVEASLSSEPLWRWHPANDCILAGQAFTVYQWQRRPGNCPNVEGREIAKDRADWLLDAVACATQNRAFLRGDPECDAVACEAILLNGEKAIQTAIVKALRCDLTHAQ